jgi:hypothetical protein
VNQGQARMAASATRSCYLTTLAREQCLEPLHRLPRRKGPRCFVSVLCVTVAPGSMRQAGGARGNDQDARVPGELP